MDSEWLSHCRAVCQTVKYVGEEIVWRERGNHEGAVTASAVILDEDRVAIQGLQFVGEVQNRQYGPYQKYSLMMSKGGRRLRVFMLEVMPKHKRSHVESDLVIFGPHIQLGDAREAGSSHVARQALSKLDDRSVNGWIKRFQRHARVYDGDNYRLSPPFDNDLFGL